MVASLSSVLCREKVKVAKASQGVEDGPHAKKAKLDVAEAATLVKKVSVGAALIGLVSGRALGVEGSFVHPVLRELPSRVVVLEGSQWSWHGEAPSW